ncbi:chloride channel protein [Escherichia coli]|nr:chloride channel protein [Escherichia coli]MCW7160553.1 chloride channel protein [Escherichia coli]
MITQQAWLINTSLLVVTSGGAIGREGAMILLAALAASCFAQRFIRQEWKLWIACGAAAGMAAYRARLLAVYL